jgi:hypothetical protein
MTRTRPAGRSVLALLLAPVLVASLWLEVVAGTQAVWYYVQPGQTSYAWLALATALAWCGPATVVAMTTRTRSRLPGVTERILRIEKWGLIVTLPLELIVFVILVNQPII